MTSRPWRIYFLLPCGMKIGRHTAKDGFSAIHLARKIRPDVVVWDVMLPDMDGFEVLERLHADFPALPVLFLTARDSVEDRVRGLSLGGDDYVTKPFALEEVVARLSALLRRSGVSAPIAGSKVTVGDLELNSGAGAG